MILITLSTLGNDPFLANNSVLYTLETPEKKTNLLKFLFSHFFVGPQKVLGRPLSPS